MLKRVLPGLIFLLSCGGDAASPPASQLPEKPGNALTSARTGEIVLNWLDVANETHYRVEFRQEGQTAWALLLEPPANTTSVTHTAARNVQYYYRVAACNNTGCSAWAETGGKWTTTGAPPTLLSSDVTGIGGNVATLSATARAGGEPVTFVFTLVKPGEMTPFFTSEPHYTEPSFATDQDGIATGFVTVNLLQPDTDYVLYVSATNLFGKSPPIGAKPFKTRPLGPPTFSNQFNGAAADGTRSFAITIHPNGFDTEYSFQMARAGESFATPVATETLYAHAANLNWPAFTLSMPRLAQPGVTYKWRVVAQNTAGTAVSDTLQFTR